MNDVLRREIKSAFGFMIFSIRNISRQKKEGDVNGRVQTRCLHIHLTINLDDYCVIFARYRIGDTDVAIFSILMLEKAVSRLRAFSTPATVYLV